MRPLRLELKGFTSFRDAAELDFTDLDVFAISGPTGSGKSSLLDAMTYALYGRVERVGDRVGQLISQGQPRMAVTLEFEVGRERYRVTRSTPAKGGTKILLQGLGADGEWKQAGEGADRVREAEPMIGRVIGLTYDGFTRSVFLPQGKFAEFLVGDPKKRRDILTELLGLSLFDRLAKRANAIAKESSIRAETMADVMQREFADATAVALNEARAAAEIAAKSAKSFAKAANEVSVLARRWDRDRAALEDLVGILAEVEGMRTLIDEGALGLEDLALRAKAAGSVLRGANAAARKALDAELRAVNARQEAQDKWGPLALLIQARAKAEGLLALEHAAGVVREGLQRAREAVPKMATSVQKARAELQRCRARLDRGERAVARREAALEKAQADDHVSALTAGRKVGDPCPVCGEPLGKLPRRPAAEVVARARAALEAARATVEATHEDLIERGRTMEAAAKDLEAGLLEEQRLTEEVERRDRDLAALAAELEPVLGAHAPLDPLAELSSRAGLLQAMIDGEERAAAAARQAEQAKARAERERDRLITAALQARARLDVDLGPLVKRASRAAGDGFIPPAMPRVPKAPDPMTMREFAMDLSRALGELARDLEQAAARRRDAGIAFLEEARALAPDLVPEETDQEHVVEAVDAAARRAAGEAAAAAQRAGDILEKIERRRGLEAETTEAAARAVRFRALGLELRADRLIAFLQAEALQVLATAASERLASMSEGRYRLVCREDEFLVVDTWNGEEERSVRTLSGGETFLASLSLALALADQVRSLSSTDRARLGSLFLDEGFGTLDQEALKVVVEAMEQLAGDGRLVGVITHVRELAEQFPRIDVLKSPRGSRLEFVP